MAYTIQQVLKGSIKNISECRHNGEVQLSEQKWGLAGTDELQLPVSGDLSVKVHKLPIPSNQLDN